jgi:hypothetical protein
MSIYPNLQPIFASSIMHVHQIGNKVKFSNVITYDYQDQIQPGNKLKSYYNFVQDTTNYNQEIQIYWESLQHFLDIEINLINSAPAAQTIRHCSINFRTKAFPFVQWLVEFEGKTKMGLNNYENEVDPERFEYPIYSLYIFHQPLVIKEVKSTMQYNLNQKQGILEYYGDTGELLEGYESISFSNE